MNTGNSSATISGQNLKLDPVQDFVFAGIQKKFLQVLQAPSVWVTSSDHTKAVAELFKGSRIKYPYVVFRLSTIKLASDRGNTKNTALRGKISVVTTDELRAFNVRFVPVDMSVSMTLYTNDHSNLRDCITRLIFSRIMGWLSFDIAYGRTAFGVTLEPPESYDLPERVADADQIQEYKLESEIQVRGYLSIPELIETQIASKIVITGQLTEIDSATGDFRILYTTSTAESPTDILAVPHPPNVI
jgi:hypothetical protein